MGYTRYLYNRIYWKNKSESLDTPLGKTNLNHMDDGIYSIAENLDIVYNELHSKKFDEANADKVIVGMPTWDPGTGILTFRFYDGTAFSVDFNIEKIPVSFSMDSAGVITMTTADGTQWTADIGELIPDYTFEDSDRIAFAKKRNADGSYTVTADIKKNSITDEYMQPEYLADITKQASGASASAKSAASSASAAEFDAKLAQSYAVGGSGVREGEDTDNAKVSKEKAAEAATLSVQKAEETKRYADAAAESGANAKESELAAKNSETNAGISESNAKAYAVSASDGASVATDKAAAASASANTADTKADEASRYAIKAESFTHGQTGTRENEDTDSAMYYYEQTKHISQGGNGLVPMGTVTFEMLPAEDITTNAMYNISEEFVSDERFQDGGGKHYGAGSNVFYTVNGKWDVLAASGVTGVKGSAETAYRQGNVNITPENIGALPVNGNAESATKASQDGNGNVIAETYSTKKELENASGKIKLPRTAESYDTLPGANTMNVREVAPTAENAPSASWYHVFTGQGDDANYQTQLAVGMTTPDALYRNRREGKWGEWIKFLDSLNYSSYALPLSGGTLKGNLSIRNPNFPNAGIDFRIDGEGANIKLSSNKSGLYYELDTVGGGLRIYTFGEDNTYRALMSTSNNKLNISGSAASATRDASGNVITNTYATKTELDALKKSVSDGKTLVANAVTGKGVTTATDASFQTMADNISKISSGVNVDALFNNGFSTYYVHETSTFNLSSSQIQTWDAETNANQLSFLGKTFKTYSIAFTTNLKEGEVGRLTSGGNAGEFTIFCIYDISSGQYHILPAGATKDVYLSTAGLVRFTTYSSGVLEIISLGSGVSKRANVTCFYLR